MVISAMAPVVKSMNATSPMPGGHRMKGQSWASTIPTTRENDRQFVGDQLSGRT
jgi:hypothetical protein